MSTRPKNREAFGRSVAEQRRELSPIQLTAILKTLLIPVNATSLRKDLLSAADDYDALQNGKFPAPHNLKSRLRVIEKATQHLITLLSEPPHEEVAPASEIIDFGPLGEMLLPVRRKEPALHYSIAEALFSVFAEELGHSDSILQIAQHILGESPQTHQYLQKMLDDLVRLRRLIQKAVSSPSPRRGHKGPRNWRERAFVGELIAIWSKHTDRQPDSIKSFNRAIKGDFVCFALAAAKAFDIRLSSSAINSIVKHHLSRT